MPPGWRLFKSFRGLDKLDRILVFIEVNGYSLDLSLRPLVEVNGYSLDLSLRPLIEVNGYSLDLSLSLSLSLFASISEDNSL